MPNQILRKMPLFRDLKDGQLDQIAALLQERHFDRGAAILREGEQGDEMFILRSGRVSVSKAIHLDVPGRGEVNFEKQLVVLQEGSYFGEVGLLAADTRSATVKAITPVELWVLEAAPVQELLERDPEMGYRLLSVMARELCERLSRANEESKKLMVAFAIAINR